MISAEEMRYLYWLGSSVWAGRGQVIEVGPWLGGSTWCLASGMESNPRFEAGSRLHAVDNFRWRPFMNARAPLGLTTDASFRKHFEQNLAPKGELVAVHEVTLPDDSSADLIHPDPVRGEFAGRIFSKSDIPGDVTLAFIDGAKSWCGLAHLMRELADDWVTGESIIVFQDYKGWATYWVPMLAELVCQTAPDALELLHVVGSNSVTFRVSGDLGEAVSRLPMTLDDVPVDRGVGLLDAASEKLRVREDRAGAAIVALSAVAFLVTKGLRQDAVARFQELERSWPIRASTAPLEHVRQFVARTCEVHVTPSPRLRRIGHYRRLARVASRLRGAAGAALPRRAPASTGASS